MLNLKEFKTMNKQVNDYYYLFNIEAKDKPTVCPMYNCETKYDAYQKFYYDFESRIPDTPTFQPFRDVLKTFNNNKDEIFNYFDRIETNAFTESINLYNKTRN